MSEALFHQIGLWDNAKMLQEMQTFFHAPLGNIFDSSQDFSDFLDKIELWELEKNHQTEKNNCVGCSLVRFLRKRDARTVCHAFLYVCMKENYVSID